MTAIDVNYPNECLAFTLTCTIKKNHGAKQDLVAEEKFQVVVYGLKSHTSQGGQHGRSLTRFL